MKCHRLKCRHVLDVHEAHRCLMIGCDCRGFLAFSPGTCTISLIIEETKSHPNERIKT